MGGDTGGNDCVHVIDLRAIKPSEFSKLPNEVRRAIYRADTDVLIHDEHGNVCQFTYAEWWDFAEKVADWQYADIGKDAHEAIRVDQCTCHETGSPCVCPDASGEVKIISAPGEPLKWAQNAHTASATGMDPSVAARLDALPDVSVEMTFEGGPDVPDVHQRTMDAAVREGDRLHAASISDPFDQPPGMVGHHIPIPRPFVNEPLAEIDTWDRRYGS